MDNYEMARGHAAVGLAGRGVGPGRASSSSPLPPRALPHSTLGFPPQKPPSRTESQYVLVFQTGPHAAQRNFKNPPGLLRRCPPPALASRSDHGSGRTATAPLGPPTCPPGMLVAATCGGTRTRLQGPGENQSVDGAAPNRSDQARPWGPAGEHSAHEGAAHRPRLRLVPLGPSRPKSDRNAPVVH